MKLSTFIKSKQIVENSILYYFSFLLLFLSIRILLITGESSSTIIQTLFSILPEFLLGLITVIVIRKIIKEPIKLKLSLFDKLFMGFIISNIVLGMFLSKQLNVSIYALRLTYLPMIFYFIARFGVIKTEYNYTKFLDFLNNIFFITAIIGLIIYFFAPAIDDYMVERSNGVVGYYFIRRMNSIIWSPVVWGSIMGFSSLYSYYKLSKKFTIKELIIFLTVWTSLFLSISRGAFMGFMVCFIIIILVEKKFKTLLITLASISIIILILNIRNNDTSKALSYISSSTVSTVIHLFLPKTVNSDSNTRVSFWKIAFDDFINKPMGYGLGKAGHVARRFFKDDDKSASVYSTDGWYLKMACETGVWGILSFTIISFFYFFQSLKYLRKKRGTINLFFFLIFIFTSIQNLGSNVLDFYIFANLYWLIIGFSQNMINNLENGKDES
jgi:hypothetical protein